MKEQNFLSIINNTLNDNSFLGDDCAFIEEGLYITQDTLVEGVHFDLSTISPFQLGYKSVAVNLSDLAAALSKPKYITISFSAPKSCSSDFVRDFYKGINFICEQYGVKVIGGDITGSEKICISITAIGKKIAQYNVSRKFAKAGDIVFTTGTHGLSAAGFYALQNKDNSFKSLVEAHIMPKPQVEAGYALADIINRDIAIMDTSDGLGDALYKIATLSGVTLKIDSNNLPKSEELFKAAKKYNKPIEDWIFWGGEDYQLIGCIPKEILNKLDKKIFFQIGEVLPQKDKPVLIDNLKSLPFIDNNAFENKTYNHFV